MDKPEESLWLTAEVRAARLPSRLTSSGVQALNQPVGIVVLSGETRASCPRELLGHSQWG